MLHVLRHYLPLRKALLITSETVLISLVVALGMTSHLWRVDTALRHLLAEEGLSRSDAIWRCALASLVVAVLTQITISFNELYDFRISNSLYDRAARFMGSAGSSVLLVSAALALAELWGDGRILDFPGLPFTQTIVLLAFSLGAAFVLLYWWRNLFHSLMRRTSFNQRLLVLGGGRLARRMVEEVQRSSESGYEIVGIVAPSGADRGGPRAADADGPSPGRVGSERRHDESGTGNPWFDAGTQGAAAAVHTIEEVDPQAPEPLSLLDPEGAPVPSPASGHSPSTGEAQGLFRMATGLDVSDIVVAFEDRRGQLPTEELLRCRMAGMTVHEAESFFEQLSGKIPAEAMRPSYLIFNRGFVQHPMAMFVKRVFDVLFGLVVLAFAWPVMILAALAIRFDSPGPILFRQERTGEGGRPFTLCKFRSMRADAEKLTGPVWAQQDDPRVTRVGRFLRRTRIDELPQLFNVIAGSMSFVGPRPERPSFVEELAGQIPYYNQRHIVKPGLTGWAQINYPYGNTVEDALQKLQYDLFYIKYQSFVFDLSIVLNTVKTVVLRKGT